MAIQPVGASKTPPRLRGSGDLVENVRVGARRGDSRPKRSWWAVAPPFRTSYLFKVIGQAIVWLPAHGRFTGAGSDASHGSGHAVAGGGGVGQCLFEPVGTAVVPIVVG